MTLQIDQNDDQSEIFKLASKLLQNDICLLVKIYKHVFNY